MTQINQTALAYYQTHYNDLFAEFLTFLRIPSVSTADVHKDDIKKAAAFLVSKLNTLGFKKLKLTRLPCTP